VESPRIPILQENNMAKITWLGEDVGDIAGPSFTTAFGDIKFPKGVAVEVADVAIVAKAKRNRFFKVEDGQPAELIDEDDLEKLTAPVKRGPGRPPKVEHDY
jgi:hypothetical protein